MSCLQIDFRVNCETKFGQYACIVGNLPELGSWTIQKGIRLFTDSKNYPIWQSTSHLLVSEGIQVQFKLCVLDEQGSLIRWEDILGNRLISPRCSLVVEFNEGEVSTICKGTSKPVAKIIPVRKGTEQILNSIPDDNSSNQEIWKQHLYEDEEETEVLLTLFANQVSKLAAMQNQQVFAALQNQPQLQQYCEWQFGAFSHHQLTIHYIITLDGDSKQINMNEREKIIILKPHEFHSIKNEDNDQVSVFYIKLVDGQSSIELLSKFKSEQNLEEQGFQIQAINNLLVLQLWGVPSIFQWNSIMGSKVNAIVCSSWNLMNELVEFLKKENWQVLCTGKNLLQAKNKNLKIKIVYESNHWEKDIYHFEHLRTKILWRQYFQFNSIQFAQQLRLCLQVSQCLIIFQLDKIQNLTAQTMSNLLQVTTKCNCFVYVLVKQKFDRINSRIPLTRRHKIIFVNHFGQIYANGQPPISLHSFTNIDKARFRETQQIVLNDIGWGIKGRIRNDGSMVVAVGNDELGKIIRQRLISSIKNQNKKTIAKIVMDDCQEGIELTPFCLHFSFIYRALIGTLATRLRGQRGVVINIDGLGTEGHRYIGYTRSKDVFSQMEDIRYLNFGLENTQKGQNNYLLTQNDLMRLIEIIYQQSNSEENMQRQLLNDVKNLR